MPSYQSGKPTQVPTQVVSASAPSPRQESLDRHEIEAELYRIDEAVARGGMTAVEVHLAHTRRGALLADLAQSRGEVAQEPRRAEAPASQPEATKAPPMGERSSLAEFGYWLAGAVLGEFNPDQSIGQIGLDTSLGLIPVVDQALDARDIIAHVYWMSKGEYDSEMRWVGVAVTAVGLIPELGTAIRGVVKVLLMGAREALGHVAELLGLLRRLMPGLTNTAALRRWLGQNWPNWAAQASQQWGTAIGRIRSQLAALPGTIASRYEQLVARIEQLAARHLKAARPNPHHDRQHPGRDQPVFISKRGGVGAAAGGRRHARARPRQRAKQSDADEQHRGRVERATLDQRGDRRVGRNHNPWETDPRGRAVGNRLRPLPEKRSNPAR